MVKGIQNRYLQIDLSVGKAETSSPPGELFTEFLGGKGAGLKVMIDHGAISGDPFDEHNPLIFVTGPFTGTPVQTSARSASSRNVGPCSRARACRSSRKDCHRVGAASIRRRGFGLFWPARNMMTGIARLASAGGSPATQANAFGP